MLREENRLLFQPDKRSDMLNTFVEHRSKHQILFYIIQRSNCLRALELD